MRTNVFRVMDINDIPNCNYSKTAKRAQSFDSMSKTFKYPPIKEVLIWPGRSLERRSRERSPLLPSGAVPQRETELATAATAGGAANGGKEAIPAPCSKATRRAPTGKRAATREIRNGQLGR